MSSINIIKGLPVSLLVNVKNGTTSVNVNDGTWTTTTELRYQTKVGPKPFDLTVIPTGNALLVQIANTQTSQLNHLGTGYVLVIRAVKNDATVNIKNEIPVSVRDDL